MTRELLVTERFTVVEKPIHRPGAAPAHRAVVVHPGAAVILPILDDGRIVMIRNQRPAIDRELLELPAGTIDPGESPEETAVREVEEETGYRAGLMEPFATFFPSPGILTERMYVFLATKLEFVGQRLEESEQIRVEIVSAQEARRRLVAGEIEDGKTIATLGLLFARREGT